MTTYVVCTPISALGIGVGAKMVVNKLIWHKAKKSIAEKNKQTEEPGGQW
jgi:hypothetical protein